MCDSRVAGRSHFDEDHFLRSEKLACEFHSKYGLQSITRENPSSPTALVLIIGMPKSSGRVSLVLTFRPTHGSDLTCFLKLQVSVGLLLGKDFQQAMKRLPTGDDADIMTIFLTLPSLADLDIVFALRLCWMQESSWPISAMALGITGPRAVDISRETKL